MENAFGNSTGINFPDSSVPEKEKDKDYHRRYAESIIKIGLNADFDRDYSVMNECYEFFNGTHTGDEFGFLQEAEDGDVLPAKWISFNKINVKGSILFSEFDRKGFDIRVEAVNKEARIRKNDIKDGMYPEMKVNNLAGELEAEYGIPFGHEANMPTTQEELDDAFREFQELSEIVIEFALKYLAKKHKLRYTRMALYRDIIIAGRCVTVFEEKEGAMVPVRKDPRYVGFDRSADDDFVSDSSYFFLVDYMSIGEIASQYNISRKELEEVRNKRREDTFLSSKYFREIDGELRALVTRCYWRDVKDWSVKETRDKHGNMHIQDVPHSKVKDVKRKSYPVWRHAVIIGGKIVPDAHWGVLENMVRSVDDFSVLETPIKILIPNYINGKGVSKVQQVIGIQKLKDITMYNLQLAMARAGSKGFVYDVAQTPEDWEVDTVIKYLKTVGIAFIDSKKDGTPSNFNQFSPVDMGLTDGVNKFIEISMMLDREMDSITGINDARQGIAQGSSQAVGVTQSMLHQSSMSTEFYSSLFQVYMSDILTYQANTLRFIDEERLISMAGNISSDLIKGELDMPLNDYGVFVEEINPMFEDLSVFRQIVNEARMSGQLGFIDAIKLMKEKDLNKAIREYERKEAKMQEQLQAQQEAQAQQAEAERQATLQRIMAQQESANNNRIELKGIDRQNDLSKILTKGKIDLTKEKLRQNAI